MILPQYIRPNRTNEKKNAILSLCENEWIPNFAHSGFVEESSSVEREGVAGEGATRRLRHVEENIV